MKLKRLLGGVTAAIMALSSVAIASFSPASAASEPALGKIWFKAYGMNQITIAQGVAGAEMEGATQAKVYFTMFDDVAYNEQTSLIISTTAGWTETSQTFKGSGWPGTGLSYDATVDLGTIMSEGDGYIIKADSDSWEQHTSADNWNFGFDKVEFLDGNGKVLVTQTEVGEEPVTELPPNDSLPIRLVDHKGNDLCEPLVISEDGTYTMSAEDFEISSTDGAIGLYCSYAGLVLSSSVKMTMDQLSINGSRVMIPSAWQTITLLGNALNFNPINSYDEGAIKPSADTVTSISITFTISGANFGAERPTTEPTVPIIAETIESIEYNYTLDEPGTAAKINWTAQESGWTNYTASADITDQTEYSVKLEDINKTRMANLGFYDDGDTNDTVITINTIVINDEYTFTVNKRLTTTGINAEGVSEPGLNGLANIWNDEGRAAVVPYTCDEAYLAGSKGVDNDGIRFVLGAPPATTDPEEPGDEPEPTDPKPVDPDASYEAFLMFCDTGYGWQNWNPNSQQVVNENGTNDGFGMDAAVNGSGTYTVGVGPACAQWEGATPTGISVMCVDIRGYAAAIGANTDGLGLNAEEARALAREKGLNITDVSIILDGEVAYKYDDADVVFGDIEGNGSGNLRIEIFNEYGSGTAQNAPQDVLDLAAGLITGTTESVEVQFTLTYNPPSIDNPGDNTSNSGNNNPTAKPTTAPTTAKPATTAAPKATTNVAAAKKAAKTAMKQAKITKLTVKSKKAKKITVTWKKVKKAVGYEVQVSSNKKFKKSKILVKKTVKKTKVTIKNKKIKSKKTYYVRVRAYATYKDAKGATQKVYSSWNKQLRKVKVK